MPKSNKGYVMDKDVIVIQRDLTDLDYIKLYAENLKKDNSLFKQQKRLIESQLQGSSSLFRNMFGVDKTFKINARKYLKKIKLI